jgi:tRNA threonylcarbamoyladenosine biosynthesis protein TsaB
LASEPLILGFDTSAAHCAAALLRGPHVLAMHEDALATGQAERLMPMLEEILQEAGVTWSELDALGVGVGPGNFTGIRIAVAAGRGLAMALGVPAVGVSGFEALSDGAPRPVLVAIDARRGQSWVQRLNPAGPQTPFQATPDSLPESMRRSGLPAVGHRANDYAAITGGAALEPCHPLPVAIARYALAHHTRPQPRPSPLYLRAADAAPSSEPTPVLLP